VDILARCTKPACTFLEERTWLYFWRRDSPVFESADVAVRAVAFQKVATEHHTGFGLEKWGVEIS
jgi:hypothetical protein